jgi:hypothetical protein
MRVKCCKNRLSQFDNSAVVARLRRSYHYDDEIPIEVGKASTVYGVVFRDNIPWFYLCDGPDYDWPTPKAADFFEVIDDRLSQHWRLALDLRPDGNTDAYLVFPEWSRDLAFYERLVGGRREEVAIFARYRAQIDAEFGY